MPRTFTQLAILFVGLFCTSSLMAEVKQVSEHGFIIENSIETQASLGQTWHALTNKVDAWWPKDHSWWQGTFSIDSQAGGCFCETKGQQSAEHMRIVFVDPQKTLRMTGGLGPLQGMGLYGAMNWQLATTDSGTTTLTLHYAVHGISADGFAQLAPIVDQVQAIQLGGLKSFLQP